MSSDTTDLAGGGQPDVMLAHALAQAVREAGRRLAGDPRRVQGMVSDVLGTESRTRRAEIDAVVLAAEEGVPEDLLANRIDLSTALARLRDRGLDDAVATFAVEVWRYALGMLAEDAEPPSLTNSLETSTRPGVTDQAPDITDQYALLGIGAGFAPPTLLPTDMNTVLPDDAPKQPVAASARQHSGARKKAVWLLVGVPVLVLAVMLGAFLVLRDDSTPTVAEGTTTSEQSTTIVGAAAEPLAFDPEATSIGESHRTWELHDGVLDATLEYTNTTATESTARYYETIPKSLAASADLVTSDPAPVVIKADPVIAWDLTIPAGGTATVTYEIDVADDADQSDLDLWSTDRATEAAAFEAERAAPPTLTVDIPDGTVINVGEVEISGTADPTATITLNDAAVPVSPSGTWTLHVGPGLAVGPNGFTANATSQYGVTTTVSFSVIVQPDPGATIPATTTTVKKTTSTTVKTVPPTPGTNPPATVAPTVPPTAPPTVPPTAPPTVPPTAPPTVPPTAPPAPISVSISGRSVVTATIAGTTSCSYTYTMTANGFTPVLIDWAPGDSAFDGQSSIGFSFGSVGGTTISVTATAPGGRTATASKFITVQPPAPPDFLCL